MSYYEAGQDLGGLGDLLGEASSALLSGPAVEGAAKNLLITTLDDPEVQDALARAARPVAIETAAYVGIGVALLMVVYKGLG